MVGWVSLVVGWLVDGSVFKLIAGKIDVHDILMVESK